MNRKRISHVSRALAVLLVAAAGAGCADDADRPLAEFTLGSKPSQVELVISKEAEKPVRLTSEIQYDTMSWKYVELTFQSSNPSVATVASLTPDQGSFTGYPTAPDILGRPTCPQGKACFYANVKDGGDLVVKCHKVGSATIQVDGKATIRDGDGNKDVGVVSTHTAYATTSFGVTCIAETGMVPGCDSGLTVPVGYVGEMLTGDGSDLCGSVDTDVSSDPTVHSSDEVEPKPGAGDHTETHARVAAQLTISQEQLDGSAGELLACGEHERGATICADPLSSPPPGEWVIVGNVTNGELPPNDPTYQYTYGFVFDADGSPINNYQADPAYPNDWYQDTDTWYEATYNPSNGWSGSARVVSDSMPLTLSDSAARFVIVDNAVFLLVPADELGSSEPDYRITAFRHPGDWGFGGDWSGDVEPPVIDGLAPFAR